MKVGDVVKVKDIDANHPKDVGKIGIIIKIFDRVGVDWQPGHVCRFYTGTEKLNYHTCRLELLND
jgi:hypothetical protein